MPKGQLIGTGRTAEIYEWADGQVLKLYLPGFTAERVDHEARQTALVKAAGTPAPAVFGTVEIEGRFGLILERVDGVLLRDILIQPYRLRQAMHWLAEIQAATHACHAPELPALKDRLRERIQQLGEQQFPGQTADVIPAVLAQLDRLPTGTAICHGDLHPENVLLTQTADGQQRPVLIDWVDVTSGDPHADVARTLLILQCWVFYAGHPVERVLRRAFMALLVHFYWRRYCAVRPATDQALVQAWQGPVAAARLLEGISAEREYLLRLVEQSVSG